MSGGTWHDTDLLYQASRGNVLRHHTAHGWKYTVNHQSVGRKHITRLMSQGLLEPSGSSGLPMIGFQRIDITIRGREEMRKRGWV